MRKARGRQRADQKKYVPSKIFAQTRLVQMSLSDATPDAGEEAPVLEWEELTVLSEVDLQKEGGIVV